MIKRNKYLNRIQTALRRSRITALLGPRQSGKTTLARIIAETVPSHFFDMEYEPDRQAFQNPYLAMEHLEGLIVIDEIQLRPELFSVLRVLSDRPDSKARWLILGSASPDIVKDTSETLAGRVEYIELSGFDINETNHDNWSDLWLKGGFPRSYLAESIEDSHAWREDFVRTFLERDIPALGLRLPAPAMRRVWVMLAHQHGQILNCSRIGRSIGVSDKTVRHYLDILTGAFMVRQLHPWYENVGKRQVKSPKIYIRDSGILHRLLTIATLKDLLSNPAVGSSWEGFVIEQVIRTIPDGDKYFWATQSGAEIDLVIRIHGKSFGLEAKFSENPTSTRSVYSAIETLNLEHVWIVHPGKNKYIINEKTTALPLSMIKILPF
jgi:uncharacterized protein